MSYLMVTEQTVNLVLNTVKAAKQKESPRSKALRAVFDARKLTRSRGEVMVFIMSTYSEQGLPDFLFIQVLTSHFRRKY